MSLKQSYKLKMNKRRLTHIFYNLLLMNRQDIIIKRSIFDRLVRRLAAFGVLYTTKLRQMYCACCLLLCEIKYRQFCANSYFDDEFDDMMKRFYSYIPHSVFHRALEKNNAKFLITIKSKRRTNKIEAVFDGYMRVIDVGVNEPLKYDVETDIKENWRGKNYSYTFTDSYIPFENWFQVKLKLINAICDLRSKNIEMNSIIYFHYVDSYNEISEEEIDYRLFYIHRRTWPPIDYDCFDDDKCCECTCGCENTVKSYLKLQNEKHRRRAISCYVFSLN